MNVQIQEQSARELQYQSVDIQVQKTPMLWVLEGNQEQKIKKKQEQLGSKLFLTHPTHTYFIVDITFLFHFLMFLLCLVNAYF